VSYDSDDPPLTEAEMVEADLRALRGDLRRAQISVEHALVTSRMHAWHVTRASLERIADELAAALLSTRKL